MLIIGGGLVLLALIAGGLWSFVSDDDPDDAIRGGSRRVAGGLRSGITLGRATGAGAFIIVETLIAEFVGIGISVFDLVGPLGASNLLAIGIGGLGLAGLVPVDPMWYVGMMLIALGIAISSVTDSIIDTSMS